jgi:PAS domain S-box-containing protein
MNQRVCSGNEEELEFQIVGIKGRRRWVHAHSVPIENPTTGTYTHLAVTRDVTMQKAVQETDRLLAAIVQSSDDAIITKDLNGFITSWNNAAERIFGYTSQEIIGKPVSILIPMERKDEEPNILARLRCGQRIDHYETIRRRKDGTLVDISLTVSPVKDSKGRIAGASKIARDISAQKQAERALRKSEMLFRQLADTMPQIVWAARPDGYIDYYNKRWYEFTGFAEKYGDESWTPILHPEDVQRRLEAYYAAIQTEQPYSIEYRFKDYRQGGYRWFLSRALPIRDESGKIIRWFGTCTDIDDQKRAAENLERAVEQRTASLREAVSQMEEFSYTVSHDLRAPARAMKCYAKIVLDDFGETLTPQAKDYLERIIRGGTRMDVLIRDVLTYSRLSRRELELHPVALDKVVSDVIQQYPQLQAPRAQTTVRAPLLPVFGHEPSLAQAISNLLINAAKFVPAGEVPRITVRTESRGDNVRLWVQDNGNGIKPEHQHRIFGIFERLTTDPQYEGTGIGLAIVRKAVEKMGGAVGLESDGLTGSRFWIELPGVNAYADTESCPAAG